MPTRQSLDFGSGQERGVRGAARDRLFQDQEEDDKQDQAQKKD